MKLLVVEDDPTLQQALLRLLGQWGYAAEAAATAGEALAWLEGLSTSAQAVHEQGDDTSLRIYTEAERELLGEECVGFLCFLESAGVLPAALREMVIDRASALGPGRLDLEEFKIIILMVFWSLGEEPDALILDELFVDPEQRLIH